MATVKVTVSVDEVQLEAVRRLVELDQADSVSGFVREALATALDDVAGWHRTVEETLARTGGPVTQAEQTWADGVLDGSGRRSVA